MSLKAIDRASTGLALAEAMIGASASNTANALTEGYRRVRATGAETPDGGVQVRLSQEQPPAPPGSGSQPPGGDLVRDAVDREGAGVLYRANLAVVRTSDDLLGEVLDILG